MRITAVGLGLALGWGLVSGACASAPIRKADLALVSTADGRVLEGCYSCLTEARDTYQRLAIGKARPLLITKLFEVQVLVGLREAELAMDPAESFKAAEALIPELPATYDAATYLTIARSIPPDGFGTPNAEFSQLARRNPTVARYNALKTGLQAGEGSAPFRAYLSASLECLRVFTGRQIQDVPRIPDDAPTLVRFRMGTCPAVIDSHMATVVAAVPGFVEAELFSARLATLNVTAAYVKRLRAALNAAKEWFPRSPSVTYGLGHLSQTTGDCMAAIRHYEDTITFKPLHEEAAMQRVVCLGHIGEFVPAIEGATRIIERRYHNYADAYYWRAWNHYQRKDLLMARNDIDGARAISVNIKVLILGGMIKYDQKQLDLAEADLSDAVKMDTRNQQCIARWYYGLVAFSRETWPEAANRFATAGTCYRNSANQARRELENMKKADVDEEFRASQILGFQAAIKEDTDQEQASYLNTANCFAMAGEIDKAKEWLAKVPADSVHALMAEQLRKLIGGSMTK
jgi:tetratricopeptide (TPR) repeat protein